MTSKRRTWGQFATPTDVADVLLGFCLRRPSDRLLDPSCGDGALRRRAARWRAWLSEQAAAPPGEALSGVELDEEAAARYIRDHVTKPGVAYIAGVTAPPGKRMGHAGAIIAGGAGTAAAKYAALEEARVRAVRSPAELGQAMKELLGG